MRKATISKIACVGAMAALLGAKGVGAQNPGTYITSDLTVGFPLEAAVADGAVRVLIPTATDSANIAATTGLWNGGVPVQGAFVSPANTNQVTVTCPTNISGMTFGTPTKQIGTIYYDPATDREITQAEAAALNGAFVRYLAFTCPYTGTGAQGGQFTGSGIGSNIVISGLLNPAAPNSTSVNEAVTIPGKIQLLNSGYTGGVATPLMVSDYDVLISAIMQDVLVTAKVESQIMFRIDGVAAGETVCGDKVTSVGTSPLLIDYGAPSVGVFVDAAQQIFIDSSAPNGYKVTLSQNNNMTRGNASCINDGLVDPTTINRDCIPNFGWKTALAPTAAQAWTAPAETGVGYTVTAVTPTVVGTNTPVANPMFNGGSDYTRLATRGSQEAVQIASSTGIAEGDVYDVCYRLSIDAQNNAGNYDNAVTYTITASL